MTTAHLRHPEEVQEAEPDLAADDPIQDMAVHKEEAVREVGGVLEGAEDHAAPRATVHKMAGITATRWPHGWSSPSAHRPFGRRSLAPATRGLQTQRRRVEAAYSELEHV